VHQVQEAHGVSERRGCAALGVGRSGVRYRSTKPDQAPLRMRICDLAKSRVRYGYFRIYILLRREGWRVNHKRVHRLYRDEGLSLRLKRPRRHVSAAHRERQPAALRPNERWSMDFVSDALFDGRRLRALTVVDAFTREALAIEVDQGIKGEQVVAVVGRLALLRGAPCAIQVDNGPEFVSKALDRWAYENGVTLDFSRPWQADRQRAGRVVQRPAARRVPERELVLVVGRREEQDRDVAAALQREPSSHRPGVANTPGIRPSGGPAGRRMRSGSSPSGRTKIRGTLKETRRLTFRTDQNPGDPHHCRRDGRRVEVDAGIRREGMVVVHAGEQAADHRQTELLGLIERERAIENRMHERERD
jgi:putative transposase